MLLLLAALVAALFAYGYWHTVTHAVLYVDVRDTHGRDLDLRDADLTFLDARGQVLAISSADDAAPGVYAISSPAEYSCRATERRAPSESGARETYRQCFSRQSRWQAGWLPAATHADARIGECRWTRVPLMLTRQPSGPADWWPLWILPHLGGSPYTSYKAMVTVDTAGCLRDGVRASPARLFKLPEHCGMARCVDVAVTPAGRFLVVTAEAASDAPMNVVVNWPSLNASGRPER